MNQRPKIGETEEDLLKQQEEFLRASGKGLPTKNVRSEEPNSNHFEILGDVVERQEPFSISTGDRSNVEQGFPKTFVIDSSLRRKKDGKKSLFSLQMEKNKQTSEELIETDEPLQDTSATSSPMEEEFNLVSNLREGVHEENLAKLSEMTEEEILSERKRLYEKLDPTMLRFLEKANKKKKPAKEQPKYLATYEVNEEEVRKNVTKYIDSKWINMDFIEKEKLEWIGDIPDKKSLEPNQPYSARFDFEGVLQPFATEIDVRNALYHHGEEPSRPGYTIQELYQLSRSSILQQRILSLNTLANIIRKTKLGYYDRCFDGQLLHKLVESDLFFLLRFSIDEKSLVSASIHCLHNLICNESDEYCLDKLLGVKKVDVQPLLFIKMEADQEEEKELKDHVIIQNDMIKGVLRTDLLVRLSYVLNKLRPTHETIIRTLNCLIRIARHSVDATLKILVTKDLMKVVYSYLKTNAPTHQCLKLLRIMSTQSKEVAVSIYNRFNVKSIISFIEADDPQDTSKKDFYLLKLETIYFWRTLLSYNLLVNEFVEWSPCLVRLLRFYVDKVDVHAENEFDFELFSGLMSLLITWNQEQKNQNIDLMIRICLEKWLTQSIRLRSYNFSISKAIGSILRYLAGQYKVYGVSMEDLEFIDKTDQLLMTLLQSEMFEEMSRELRNYSYVLSSTAVTRDPDNLPSLCSVYYGGDEFLRIVHTRSPLPLFISLVKYLKRVCRICKKSKSTVKMVFDCVQFRKYILKSYRCNFKEFNWFMKYETDFLKIVLDLLVLVDNRECINLSYRLFPLLRVDDKKAEKVLRVICDQDNWQIEKLDFLRSYQETCSTLLFQTGGEKSYKNDLIPQEWPYKVLGHLRGKDDSTHVSNALRFIYFISDLSPKLFDKIPHSLRYFYLCTVFLTDSNVFDSKIQVLVSQIFQDIMENRYKVDLNVKYEKNKSFYDLFTEVITQYAAVSYGLPIFAELVTFPLQNRFNVSYRKLLWFEYMHVLRVINLPAPVDSFEDMRDYFEPVETDESLLVAYLNSLMNNVITKSRNPFIYYIAVGNVKSYLDWESSDRDEKLLKHLKDKMRKPKAKEVQKDILEFSIKK